MEQLDYSEEITKKIEDIKSKVLSGDISLLDIELVPIFNSLKNTLSTYNINKYSTTYKKVFRLLIQKFEELKFLLTQLDNEEIFLNYLNTNPEDLEIYQLFEGCWKKPFNIESLSLRFLESSKDKLCTEKRAFPIITLVDKIELKENFLLEVPKQKFTEKMMDFFNSIKDKLPCSYDEIFEEDKVQVKIFEKFVYLLHLLQLGKIKYQKESNFLYL
ncbi:hypothetical protein LCGC14_0955570 [marine sediment metagenome]|uniref:Uncharacterized protein n=1 Tax=marine sediment metagenome TaxID=412755 RepID=A0A0F9RME3_9ZZZZ